MASVMLAPSRISAAMAASRAATASARTSTSPARACGMKATPEASATTRSPSATSTPAIVTVVPNVRSRRRVRAVRGMVPRAKTGKLRASASATSRHTPSATTPANLRLVLPNVNRPPQQETSVRPPLATTITSPALAAAMARVAIMRTRSITRVRFELDRARHARQPRAATLGPQSTDTGRQPEAFQGIADRRRVEPRQASHQFARPLHATHCTAPVLYSEGLDHSHS
jgi:hypothetical protein